MGLFLDFFYPILLFDVSDFMSISHCVDGYGFVIHILKSGNMIPLALLFLLKMALAI